MNKEKAVWCMKGKQKWPRLAGMGISAAPDHCVRGRLPMLQGLEAGQYPVHPVKRRLRPSAG